MVSGRLIDADKLIEKLTNTINEWIEDMPDGEYLKGNVNFSVVARDMIREQPTAFDVDKVLKKISERNREYHKKYRDYEEEEFGTLEEIFYQKAKTMAEAYDIVKAGEVIEQKN